MMMRNLKSYASLSEAMQEALDLKHYPTTHEIFVDGTRPRHNLPMDRAFHFNFVCPAGPL
jgi:hypothetical protein